MQLALSSPRLSNPLLLWIFLLIDIFCTLSFCILNLSFVISTAYGASQMPECSLLQTHFLPSYCSTY